MEKLSAMAKNLFVNCVPNYMMIDLCQYLLGTKILITGGMSLVFVVTERLTPRMFQVNGFSISYYFFISLFASINDKKHAEFLHLIDTIQKLLKIKQLLN